MISGVQTQTQDLKNAVPTPVISEIRSWWCVPEYLCKQTRTKKQWTPMLGGSGYCRQTKKWNTHSYTVWVRGKKTGNDAGQKELTIWTEYMKQEPRTCWSRQMQVGLELDIETKCDGNWICDVSYSTAVVVLNAWLLTCEVWKEREGESWGYHVGRK